MNFPLRRLKSEGRFDAREGGFSYTERTPIRTGRRTPGALGVLIVVIVVVLVVIAL